MISIVICHRNKQLLGQISANIAETIGVEYELVVVDNTANQYNIFQAYNVGIERAKGEIICLSHEDIIFHTQGWGKLVETHFEDPQLGAVGICGGNSMPACPAPWWNSTVLNEHFANHISTWPGEESFHDYQNPYNQKAAECVSLDGAWICVPRRLFSKVRFDEQTFQGFHFYDLDICMQIVQAGYKVKVVYDVLLEHFSKGSINKDWADSGVLFADKWQHVLPLCLREASPEKIYEYNNAALLTYAYWIQSINVADLEIRKRIARYRKRFVRAGKKKDEKALMLSLWESWGYKKARYIYRVLKFMP